MTLHLPDRVRSLPAVLLVVLALLGSIVTTTPSARADDGAVMRIAGGDRVATAAAVATTGWSEAPRVLIATARDYPDAVAAAAYAASLDAPLLLTNPGGLDQPVVDAVKALGTKRATILGGPKAVSEVVRTDLEALGVDVQRIAGDSRWGTAAELADQVARRGPVEVVAVALGDRGDGRDAWPDALAAASLAALDEPVPTLLTTRSDLPAQTELALQRLRPDRVLLLGGPGAIDPRVEQQIAALGIEVDRLEGDNRYQTGVAVAEEAMDGPHEDHGSLEAAAAVFVSGEGFADALGAGALAAHLDAPLLLVPGDVLAESVDAFVRSDETAFEEAVIVGGTTVISDHIGDELAAAMLGQPRPAPPGPACDLEFSSPDCAYTYRHSVKTWEDLAQCESHQNWQANTGNGYYGGLQFHPNTWQNVGGTGLPHEHSKWEQIHRGEILQERAGWGQWPHCSRKLGYR